MRSATNDAALPEHRLPQRLRQLAEVLVRQRQGQRIVARLRQDAGEAGTGVILELVGVEVEGSALGLRRVGAREGGLGELADQKGAEQMRVALAERALAHVDDEDATLVHDLPRSMVLLGWPMMLRRAPADSTASSLFRIGAITSVRKASS